MNVILNVTTTPVALPIGVVAGLLALSIAGPQGNQVVDTTGQVIAAQQVSGTTATFANVPVGDYVASVVRLDVNGTPIGAPVVQAFSVAAPASAPEPEAVQAPAAVPTYEAPQSITITLG